METTEKRLKPSARRCIEYLKKAGGLYVPLPVLQSRFIGGSEAARRLREAKDAGERIEQDYRLYNGAKCSCYRIPPKPVQLELAVGSISLGQ